MWPPSRLTCQVGNALLDMQQISMGRNKVLDSAAFLGIEQRQQRRLWYASTTSTAKSSPREERGICECDHCLLMKYLTEFEFALKLETVTTGKQEAAFVVTNRPRAHVSRLLMSVVRPIVRVEKLGHSSEMRFVIKVADNVDPAPVVQSVFTGDNSQTGLGVVIRMTEKR
ncbi:unnamed protein product [Soboliphyme baturini]|uniref:Uncharacterized protein n=1 Tax=Soboliphyme baturini TaxID=241478 RepID=A0A183IN01_9BILA|nr:unnamed protein product [Soboliphyme baturini]